MLQTNMLLITLGTCDTTREPAIADALDGAAACDPPRQEDNAAQPVVHNQAVHIPSVHSPTAHAVDGNAAVDAVQVDVNTAQELVVQKEASLAADSSMVYHTAGQVGHTDASNLIGSVLCCHTVLHTLVLWASTCWDFGVCCCHAEVFKPTACSTAWGWPKA